MGKGSGVLLLIVAIFVAYLGASGKYSCVVKMFLCISGKCDCECPKQQTVASTTIGSNASPLVSGIFQIPPIPKIGALRGV